ncbi:hypothetical protein HYC85_026139 [Camellia sinensis]|uniref:Uncharacterized protein n=1 Tax=Camellia sinensis TaxID=4442 RepID=A0A7J7G2Q4_CAMSI|nr:hypothetical protein HYC85_026139 [Camellia sinensis]
MLLKPRHAPKTHTSGMKTKKGLQIQRKVYKSIQVYQWYIATKTILLPRDNASKVYPKLCQSTINAERLNQLAHFTATKVGTEGGFYRS